MIAKVLVFVQDGLGGKGGGAYDRVVFRKIFRGGVDMNIHHQYSKIFKVNFYEVVYAILTLFGINSRPTLLVKFFFVTTTVA